MELQLGSLYGELAEICQELHIEKMSEVELKASADFIFPESYIGFKGHFPGQPVLPAIIQLAMVRYLAEHCLEKKLTLKSCSKTKFRAMVQPEMGVTVGLELKRKQAEWGGPFTLKRQSGETVASGFVEFAG